MFFNMNVVFDWVFKSVYISFFWFGLFLWEIYIGIIIEVLFVMLLWFWRDDDLIFFVWDGKGCDLCIEFFDFLFFEFLFGFVLCILLWRDVGWFLL